MWIQLYIGFVSALWHKFDKSLKEHVCREIHGFFYIGLLEAYIPNSLRAHRNIKHPHMICLFFFFFKFPTTTSIVMKCAPSKPVMSPTTLLSSPIVVFCVLNDWHQAHMWIHTHALSHTLSDIQPCHSTSGSCQTFRVVITHTSELRPCNRT